MGNDSFLEEDEGIDLSSPRKATLEELEQEEEQAKPVITKAERKKREKKQTKLTYAIVGGIVGLFIIAGVIFYFVGGKEVIRELPFMVQEGGAVDQNESDLDESDWYIGNQQSYGIYAQITEVCSMYNKPTSWGNAIQSFNVGDVVFVLGDVYSSKDNELMNYYYVKSGDNKGYINLDNLAIVWDSLDDEIISEDIEEEEDLSELDAEKFAFNMQKAAEHMEELNETTEDQTNLINRQAYLNEELLKLNMQIEDGVNFETDEDGNLVMIEDYPYSEEEYAALIQERESVQNELESINQQIDNLSE